MAWIDDEGRIHRNGSPRQTSSPPSDRSTSAARPRTVYCSDRSYVIAGILAIEFGFLGAHNFYIKNKRKGLTQLIASVVALFFLDSIPGLTGLALIGIWVWGVVEGVMIFTGKIDKDGEGADFWRKWFVHLDSAKYVKPYSYPHTKAWVIVGLASSIYVYTILVPMIGILF